MNYRHAFHAGNHGDVLKHAVLARVLDYMTAKDKPLAVLDAHAGIGLYDLTGVEAFKTGEWEQGIGVLMSKPQPPDIENLLAPYLNIIRALNPSGGTQHYPGSPEIIRRMLRTQDRILLNELHPEDRNTLASRFLGDYRVRVSGADAFQAVKTALPFTERRGLVLIDPAFEVTDETDRVIRMVQHGLRRQAAATFMVWYPVTTLEFGDSLCDAIKTLGAANTLDARVMVKVPHQDAGLAGSGLIIINPPWTLHDELQTLLPALALVLGKSKWGKGSVRWLTPPR